MNRKISLLFFLVIVLLLVGAIQVSAHSQQSINKPEELEAAMAVSLSTGFTYQGQLIQNGDPVTSVCDFQFELWDSTSGGIQIGSTQSLNNINVSDGLFTSLIDFGNDVFNGDARWLAISVRCPAGAGRSRPP